MMRGYIGNTDFEWFDFLRRQSPLEEVNFWKPSARLFRAEPDSWFFFRLKSPRNRIGGFGRFLRYERAPLSLAWESFHTRNGAPDLVTMRRMIEQYRAEGTTAPSFNPEIGCIMIGEPEFFSETEWIEQPHDWRRQSPPGLSYELETGEGRRVLEECLVRSKHPARDLSEPGARYALRQNVAQRLGQGSFRVAVSAAYGRACAVTTEHSLPALQAAHIRSFSQEGPHAVSNGILLRADIHALFDAGYVTVTSDSHFEVSRRLREDYQNGRSYERHHGHLVTIPRAVTDRPDPTLLAWHNENVYLG